MKKCYNDIINTSKTTKGKLFDWFYNDNLKTNISKCPFFFSPCKPMKIKIKDYTIKSAKIENFLV